MPFRLIRHVGLGNVVFVVGLCCPGSAGHLLDFICIVGAVRMDRAVLATKIDESLLVSVAGNHVVRVE